MRVVIFLLFLLAFCSGYGAAVFMTSSDADVEQASAVSSVVLGPREVSGPKDRIDESQVHVFPDQIVIDLAGAQWSRFTDTNSMDPVLDAGHNALQIEPSVPEEIEVGDIISFDTEYGVVIHRVIETGIDGEGWYAVTRGDNAPFSDPFKVRFSQVKRVVVGILY